MLLILVAGVVLKLVSFPKHFSRNDSEGEDREYEIKVEGATSR